MNKPLKKHEIVPLSGKRLKGRSWKTALTDDELAAVLDVVTKASLYLNRVDWTSSRSVNIEHTVASDPRAYTILAEKFSQFLGESVTADNLYGLKVVNNVYLGHQRIEVTRWKENRLQNLALILRGQLYATPRG